MSDEHHKFFKFQLTYYRLSIKHPPCGGCRWSVVKCFVFWLEECVLSSFRWLVSSLSLGSDVSHLGAGVSAGLEGEWLSTCCCNPGLHLSPHLRVTLAWAAHTACSVLGAVRTTLQYSVNRDNQGQ